MDSDGSDSDEAFDERLVREMVYDGLAWNEHGVSIEKMDIAVAPCAGPVAMVRKSGMAMELSNTKAALSGDVCIFTAAGELVCRIDPRTLAGRSDERLFLGWSSSEQLAIVASNGTISLVSPVGHPQGQPLRVLPASEQREAEVEDAVVAGDVAVLCVTLEQEEQVQGVEYQVVVVDGLSAISTGRAPKVYSAKVARRPEAVTILDAVNGTPSGRTEVLLSLQRRADDVAVWKVELADRSVGAADEAEESGGGGGGGGGTHARLGRVPCIATTTPLPMQRLSDAVIEAMVTDMTPSPEGSYLACLEEPATVAVLRADLRQRITQVDLSDLSRQGPPSQLLWCGSDVLAVVWQSSVLLVMIPSGEFKHIPCASHVHAAQELDGLRLYTDRKHHFVSLLEPRVAELTTIQFSMSAAARLNDAAREVESGVPTGGAVLTELHADESAYPPGQNATEPQVGLSGAVADLLHAAAHVLEPEKQRQLLRAARLGLDRCTHISPSAFVAAHKRCRLLNHLRRRGRPGGSYPLTPRQLDFLGVEVVVDRLAQRFQHDLALRVRGFLTMPKEVEARLLTHWAISLIAHDTAQGGRARDVAAGREEEEGGEGEAPAAERALLEAICQRLVPARHVAFADIAAAAFAQKRRWLATRLLDREAQLGNQVPLLLSMREGERAVRKAASSGSDGQLLMALAYLRKKILQDRDVTVAGPRAAASAAALSRASGGRIVPKPGAATRAQAELVFFGLVSRLPPPASRALEGWSLLRAPGMLLPLLLATGRPASLGVARMRCLSQSRGGAEGDSSDEEGAAAAARSSRTGKDAPPLQTLADALKRGPDALYALGTDAVGLPPGEGAPAIAGLPAAAAAAQMSTGAAEGGHRGSLGRLDVQRAAADAEVGWIAAAVADAAKLRQHLESSGLGEQLEASAASDRGVPVTSASDLVQALLEQGQEAKATRAGKDLGVPEARVWLLKVYALARKQDWSGLQAMAGHRRVPLGLEPIVTACLEGGRPDVASKAAAKEADHARRSALLLRCNEGVAAADAAVRAGDPAAIAAVLQAADRVGLPMAKRQELQSYLA